MILRKLFVYLLCFPLVASAIQRNDRLKKYKDSISIEIQKIDSDSLIAGRYYKEANYAMRSLNALSLGRTYIDSAYYYSEKAHHQDLLAKCHYMYGVLERVEGNYQKALDHLDKNIDHFKNDSTLKSYAFFQKGVIYNEIGSYEKSLRTYLNILDIFEAKKDSFATASTLNSIAVLNGKLNQNTKALANLKKALVIFENLDAKRDVSNTSKNIGEVYFTERQPDSAKKYLERSLKIAREINEPYTLSSSLHALGSIYLEENPEEAFRYFKEAERLIGKTNFNQNKIIIYRDLGKYYESKGNYIQAIAYFSKSLSIADTIQELPYQRELNGYLSEVYFKLNNFEKAYEFQKQHMVYKDSILQKEKLKAVNALQIQFETQKKEKALLEQKLLLDIKEEAYQKKETQFYLLLAVSVFLLLVTILIILFFRQRQKRKYQEILTLKREHQIKTLELLIAGEEKERERIAKELHDGVNGGLSAIKYKLVSLLDVNHKEINEAVEMIDTSCQQVRAISHNLIPPSLENFSLVEAIETYCQSMKNTHKVEVNFLFIGDDLKFNKRQEINIFRIVQELINNSIKHAFATEINVQLSHRNHNMLITVEDNGKGFNVNQEFKDGIGFKNIKSRVEYLNAEFDIISNKNGTSATIEVDTNETR